MGGNSSSKAAAAAVDAAEDAAADVAEDAVDAYNRTAEAETITSQCLSKGMTIGTTAGHAGTMCPHGTTAGPATTAILATKKAQQNKTRWSAVHANTTKQSYRVLQRARPMPANNNNSNKPTLTNQRPQPCPMAWRRNILLNNSSNK